MLIKNTVVFNFEGAFRGMRAPMNSWDKSDSFFGLINLDVEHPDADWVVDSWINYENTLRAQTCEEPLNLNNNMDTFYATIDTYCEWMRNTGVLRIDNDLADVAFLGYNDLELAQKLIKGGSEHAKFLRQIMISVDIVAPLYWWKEMDTYKIGTTANSTSTMHKLTATPITTDMFETSTLNNNYFNQTIELCENLRQKYLKTKDKIYWYTLIQLLPQSYLQTRTWTANYAVLRNIYFQRKNHKLIEWQIFCEWIETLPYAKELITLEAKDEIN